MSAARKRAEALRLRHKGIPTHAESGCAACGMAADVLVVSDALGLATRALEYITGRDVAGMEGHQRNEDVAAAALSGVAGVLTEEGT